MPKAKVKRHKRRTKKGRTTVKKHVRKIKGGRITKEDRKIFNVMTDGTLKKEYGGYLDFDRKHRLERFEVVPGHSNYVEVDPDYEVLFHTHTGKFSEPPSPDDLTTLIKYGNQAEIIFSSGATYLIIPTKKARRLKHLHFNTLNSRFRKLWKKSFIGSRTMMEVEMKYLNLLRKEGFIIKRETDRNKGLNIPIKIVEERK